MTRLLLPFTQRVDVCAIDAALLLAQQYDATLVAFSLIHSSGMQNMQGVQQEHLQQSRDFLDVVQQKAIQMEVPVARVELSTQDTVQSIHVFARELKCAGILLFLREEAGVLLATSEVKQILEQESVPLYLRRLPTKDNMFSRPRWGLRWFQRQRGCQGELIKIHNVSAEAISRQRGVHTSRYV